MHVGWAMGSYLLLVCTYISKIHALKEINKKEIEVNKKLVTTV